MRPSELRFLLDKATAGAEVYKSIFITTEEDALRTRVRELLPLLLQLWEAVAEEEAVLAAHDFGSHKDHYAQVQAALAALDQYGEGEK
jgi:hypothetical protein